MNGTKKALNVYQD